MPPIVRAAMTLALLAVPAGALAQEDRDWPCQQREVRHLSWGQMWTGPALPDPESTREDGQVASLAARLSARRTEIDAAPALIDEAGIEEEAQLVALFAVAFSQIDQERVRIIDGILRYSRKERARRDRIDALREEIEARSAAAGAEDYDELDAIEALQDDLAWETRIYQDRRRSLEFVCESPVTLEKRAFALARIIQQRLP